MKKNYKIKVILATVLILFIVNLTPVFAQNINFKIPNPSRFDNVEQIISAAGSLIRPVLLITFAGMILFGAFQLLTSQGNEDKVAGAKQTLTAAIIGFIIAVLAPTIVNVFTNLLGVQGLG